MDVPLPPGIVGHDLVRIAVTSSKSAVLSSMLRNLGYTYLVRRPVHREAFELLLRHALHRSPNELRQDARAPIGTDARLQPGRLRWPHRCTLLDLSASGCRVVTRQDLPVLSVVTLWLGPSVAGRRFTSLSGRIIRRRLDESSGEWSLAIRFVNVTAAQRGRLDDLLECSTVGPTSPLPDPAASSLNARAQTLLTRDRGASSLAAPASAESSEADDELPERRFYPRAAFHHEVVTLDDDRLRVQTVLTACDLSTLGLRVEPHPELDLGQTVIVAIHDPVGEGSIEIDAEVVRDDGPRGIVLTFSNMTADVAARLDQMVGALPALESLQPGRRKVMVGRIRTQRRRIPRESPPGVATDHAADLTAPTPPTQLAPPGLGAWPLRRDPLNERAQTLRRHRRSRRQRRH
jgi:hypothetical protein